MDPDREPIRQRQGRLPWWAWILIAGCLIYAFLIGPFNLFGP